MSFMNARAQGLFKATDFMKSKSLFFEKLKIERQGGGKYTTVFEQYIDYYVNNFVLYLRHLTGLNVTIHLMNSHQMNIMNVWNICMSIMQHFLKV